MEATGLHLLFEQTATAADDWVTDGIHQIGEPTPFDEHNGDV